MLTEGVQTLTEIKTTLSLFCRYSRHRCRNAGSGIRRPLVSYYSAVTTDTISLYHTYVELILLHLQNFVFAVASTSDREIE
jgi:hypothetical protein